MSEESCNHLIEYAETKAGGPVSRCNKCGREWGKWVDSPTQLQSVMAFDVGTGAQIWSLVNEEPK